MEIHITGSPKEIADLVYEIQNRRDIDMQINREMISKHNKELKKRTCPYCGGEHLMKAYDNGINGNNVPDYLGNICQDCGYVFN